MMEKDKQKQGQESGSGGFSPGKTYSQIIGEKIASLLVLAS